MLDFEEQLIATGGIGAPINDNDFLLFNHTPNRDNRGEFTRLFDIEVLGNLCKRRIELSQISFSYNDLAFTRRGLHVRKWPKLESKFVRVLRGSVNDLILDCRPGSPSFGSWAMFNLSAGEGSGICVPGGFAHGIQTLEDNTVLVYAMEINFDETADVAINGDDKDLAIIWTYPISQISEKDYSAKSWAEYTQSI